MAQWNKMSRREQGFTASAGILLIAAGLLGIRCGASGIDAMFAALAAALCVVLPGWVAARLLGAAEHGIAATATLTCGMALLALSSILASATGLHLLIWLPGIAGIAGFLLYARFGRPQRTSARFPVALLLVFALLALLYALAGAAQFARPSAVGPVVPQHDFFWNAGNASSFLLGFPPRDLRFSGVTLTYHYLNELVAAGLSMATGISPYDILAFYQTPLLLLGLLLVLWELGSLVFEGEQSKSWLFLLTVFGLGCAGMWKLLPEGMSPFWNLSLRHILTNINAVAIGTLFLAAFAALFFALEKQGFRSTELAVLTAVAFFLLTFAKGPVAGLVAIATGCTAVLLLPRRGIDRLRLGLLALVVAGGFALIFTTFFSAGAGTSVHFSLDGTLSKSYFANFLALIKAQHPGLYPLTLPLFMLLQAVCLCPATVPLFLFGAAGDSAKLPHLSGTRLFASAMAAGGLLAFFLFDHEAMSQIYFAFAGLFFAGLLAVAHLEDAVRWLEARRPLLRGALGFAAAACLLVSLTTTLCSGIYFARSGTELLFARAETVAQLPGKTPLSPAEEEAMDWLHENLPEDALFATNRIHSGTALEGLSNVYSGLSGRQAYLEGFKYEVSNMGVPIEEVTRRLAVVETLFSPDATALRAETLCREESISCIVLCKTVEGSNAAFASRTPRFENDDIAIYMMTEKGEP